MLASVKSRLVITAKWHHHNHIRLLIVDKTQVNSGNNSTKVNSQSWNLHPSTMTLTVG